MIKRIDENLIEEKIERCVKVIEHAATNHRNAIYETADGALSKPIKAIKC